MYMGMEMHFDDQEYFLSFQIPHLDPGCLDEALGGRDDRAMGNRRHLPRPPGSALAWHAIQRFKLHCKGNPSPKSVATLHTKYVHNCTLP